MEQFLNTDITYLKGVGPARAELLSKELGIKTFGDLLLHFPYRYIDTSALNNIGQLRDDMEYVSLSGKISNIKYEGSGHKKRLTALFSDNTGSIELIWFRGVGYIEKSLKADAQYNLFGKLNLFNYKFSIPHPELELVDPNDTNVRPKMMPLYPSTEKLRNRGLNNRQIGKLTALLIEQLSSNPIWEVLPEYLITENKLLDWNSTLINIHYPNNDTLLQRAIRRIKWQELLITQLKINRLKVKHQKINGWVFNKIDHYFNDFYNHYLPFELTNSQKKVIKEIRRDTLQGFQMNRLLQGDVGSGKTIVALLTILMALDNGFQACLMAPTEILAQQHFFGIRELLQPTGIEVGFLSGSVKGKERKKIFDQLSSGDIKIIIGTHALLEEKVVFKNLGLAIIDEQHRFGVEQRSKLWHKNTKPPHILVMTATPIPRTLAMTVYGDLEVSVIDELPPGRKPITTIHRNEMYRAQVMEFIRLEIDKGRQVYIVYPLINESEKLDYENLVKGYDQVRAYFPEPKYHVAMVHGQQDTATKESNMRTFINGKSHILVSTTVIEVGVNVPNASIMLIESAERFGLSQLHQLRGRVGRGAEKSYCILLTSYKLSKESRARMKIMTSISDGFQIAEEDLKMRGPGDIFGTKQSGVALEFRLADIVNDVALIQETKEVAESILSKDPDLSLAVNQLLNLEIAKTIPKSKGIKWDRIS